MKNPILPSDHDPIRWMSQALRLARKAWGDTHPNPMVGALVTLDGVPLSEGFHARAGALHAERLALLSLPELTPDQRKRAILHVTLEPCCTHGRTPPCTDIILESGIGNVVIGSLDPNPAHAGRAIPLLQKHGIKVSTGILAEDCDDLNLIFNHWITQGTPLIALKTATTIDGKTATRTGASRWITGPEARLDVMRWRRLFPAIAVGAGTALTDDPVLSSRLPDEDPWCPIRFVFDRRGLTLGKRPTLQLFEDAFRHRTILVGNSQTPIPQPAVLENTGVRFWRIPSTDEPSFWEGFRQRCVAESITAVFFEGGASLHASLLRNKQADYCFAYRAPLIFADREASPLADSLAPDSPELAPRLSHVRHDSLGPDQLMRGFLSYPS